MSTCRQHYVDMSSTSREVFNVDMKKDADDSPTVSYVVNVNCSLLFLVVSKKAKITISYVANVKVVNVLSKFYTFFT